MNINEIKEKYAVNTADEAMERIVDLGYDYDGFSNEKDLKSLIDELVELAVLAKNLMKPEKQINHSAKMNEKEKESIETNHIDQETLLKYTVKNISKRACEERYHLYKEHDPCYNCLYHTAKGCSADTYCIIKHSMEKNAKDPYLKN